MRKEREKKKQVSGVAAANSLDNCEQTVPSWVVSWMSAAMATMWQWQYTATTKFIVGSTRDSDVQRAKLFRGNIASYFTNTISDDHTILQVNRTWEKP